MVLVLVSLHYDCHLLLSLPLLSSADTSRGLWRTWNHAFRLCKIYVYHWVRWTFYLQHFRYVSSNGRAEDDGLSCRWRQAERKQGWSSTNCFLTCLTCASWQSILIYIELHTSTIGCLRHFWICFMGQEGRTDAGAPHSLGSVSTGAGAVVAASCILADLIVSALMRPVSALIDVCRRPWKTSCR